MILHPLLLLACYAIAIVGAALFGIWAHSVLSLSHTRMQMVMSFVAGLILGVALYHLIPHSVDQIQDPDAVGVATWWMIIGILLMVFLLRVFRFHQHDVRESGIHNHDEIRRKDPSLGWVGVVVGLGIHTLTEGAALGAAVRSGLHGTSDAILTSFGIFLAILFHKPLDSFSILGLMPVSHIRFRAAVAINIGIALLCPVSAYLAYWGFGIFGPDEGGAIGRALAFGAGALMCISLSDLLPEIHFHGHDRILLTVSLLAGVSLAYGLHLLEHLPVLGLAP
ncbi:MAG: hypothetical protein OXH99_17275 [Bryobacterales bacterium]|nr:hypothetical protein [Bryobacterales bacterium]